MTNKTDYRSTQELLAKKTTTSAITTKSDAHTSSFDKRLSALLLILICVAWIGLDHSTGGLFQAQILPASFILSCLLLLRANAR